VSCGVRPTQVPAVSLRSSSGVVVLSSVATPEGDADGTTVPDMHCVPPAPPTAAASRPWTPASRLLFFMRGVTGPRSGDRRRRDS
jgi:hypothetical protein